MHCLRIFTIVCITVLATGCGRAGKKSSNGPGADVPVPAADKCSKQLRLNTLIAQQTEQNECGDVQTVVPTPATPAKPASEDDKGPDLSAGPFSIDTPLSDFSGQGALSVAWNRSLDAVSYDVSLHASADCTNSVWSKQGVTEIQVEIPDIEDGTYWSCVTAKAANGSLRAANNNPYRFHVARLTYSVGSIIGLRFGEKNFQHQHWGSVPASADISAAVSGDFDGDGKKDIALWNRSTGDVNVGTSDGRFFYLTKWAAYSPAVVWQFFAGDVNGDGRDDLIGVVPEDGDFWIGLSTGNAFTVSLWANLNDVLGWRYFGIGDFNDDNKTDVIAQSNGGAWWVGLSDGTMFQATVWATWSASVQWVGAMAVDIDGDKKTDITARDLDSGIWWVGFSDGASLVTQAYATFSTTPIWSAPVAADFNGDGKSDWLAATTADGYLGGFWMTLGTSEPTKIYSSFSANPPINPASILKTGRFDQDTKSDLLLLDTANEVFIRKGSALADGATICCLSVATSVGKAAKPDGTPLNYKLPVVFDADGDGIDELFFILTGAP